MLLWEGPGPAPPPPPRACEAFSSRSPAAAETLLLFMRLPTSLRQRGRRMGSIRHVPFIRHLNSPGCWPRVSAGPSAQSSPATAGAGASHSSPGAFWAGFALIKTFQLLCSDQIKGEASQHLGSGLAPEVGSVRGQPSAPAPRSQARPCSPFPATWSCARNPCSRRGGAIGTTLPATASRCRATSCLWIHFISIAAVGKQLGKMPGSECHVLWGRPHSSQRLPAAVSVSCGR